MCTGRVDLAFLLRALRDGADGVIIGGCWPGECHYVTEGNYDALGNLYLCRKLLSHVGISPKRVHLEWIASSEGNRFAEVMSRFADGVRELGPIGHAEGIDAAEARARIEAASALVPFIKLVERFKLRTPARTADGVRAFYESAEADRLFDEIVGEKLLMSRLSSLLRARPRSTVEISEALSLSPAETSRLVAHSSELGLVHFDLDDQRYALAQVR